MKHQTYLPKGNMKNMQNTLANNEKDGCSGIPVPGIYHDKTLKHFNKMKGTN